MISHGSSEPYPARRLYGAAASPTVEDERLFFEGLRLPNGTWKTTADRRLDDLNEVIGQHLPDRRPLRIKDVAVSSGISTLEWCGALDTAGVGFGMTATDLFVDASLVETYGGLVLLTHGHELLQFEVRDRAFRPDQNWRSRVVCAVPLWLVRHRRVLDVLTRRRSEISLVSPRLSNVTVIEEDLLDRPSGKWDVIRAANVLNRSYFPDDVLRVMLANLISSLSDGGLLVVCRTDREAGNQATLFRRVQDGRVEMVDELNGGSETAGLALSTSAATGST